MSEGEDRRWEDGFRELLNQLVSRRVDPLASELTSFQTTFDAVCSRLVEQAHSSKEEAIEAISTAMRQRLAQSEETFRARIESLQSDFEQAQRADRARLNASIAEIDRQRTQAGVLGATLEATAAYAQRVALFAVRSGNVVGWRGLGFLNESETIALISSPLAERTLLSDALNERQSLAVAGAFEPVYMGFLDSRLGNLPAQAVAVPLVVRDKAAAVLYADSETPNGLDVQPLEALMRAASMAIELLPLRRSTEPINAEVPGPRILTASLQSVGATTSAAVQTETHRLEPAIDRVAESIVPEPAAVVDEPATTVEPATEAIASSAVAGTINSTPTDPREHLNARRFARFLIGEIRLYQPSRVKEGCRRADLYDRLRDEIERSRKLYDRHVSSQITAEFDYFYHELVTTLAEGNATKLGRNFPAPHL